MRILHVIHSLNPAGGGPAEVIRQLAPLYNRDGHDITVASMDRPDEPFLQNYPVSVHAFGPSMSGYGFNPRYRTWLRKEHNNFDAVVVHGLWQYPGYATWRTLRRTNTPYFVFPHGMLDPWFQRAYPLKHIKKSVYWQVERHVLADAAAVLFTAEQERINASKSFGDWQCRSAVVGLGCAPPVGDPQEFKDGFLRRFPQLAGADIMLFLGRIHEKKGCDLLLQALPDALAINPDLHLLLAGPDNDGYTEQLLANLPSALADHVTFAGMLSGETKWGALYASQSLILPSHQENFGIVVAEALAFGKPVLISDKVNIWREIKDEGAGLVAADDLSGIRSLLQNWLNLSAAEKSAMSLAAAACFKKHFEIESAYAKINEVVQTSRV